MVVSSHSYHSDHPTTNQPAHFIVSNLGIQGGLLFELICTLVISKKITI